MPVLPQLPPDVLSVAYVNEQGCVEVSVLIGAVEVSRYAFSQTVEEMRAERSRIAREALATADPHYWPQQEG